MSDPYTLRILPGHFKRNPTASKSPVVLVNSSGNTATVTLNRPKAFNVLNDNMVKQLLVEVNNLNNNPNVKVSYFGYIPIN